MMNEFTDQELKEWLWNKNNPTGNAVASRLVEMQIQIDQLSNQVEIMTKAHGHWYERGQRDRQEAIRNGLLDLLDIKRVEK
tara:strand:+ start:1624 stop:1866 length:243 start_codon:yes stop_codon:yes gene_type:complete